MGIGETHNPWLPLPARTPLRPHPAIWPPYIHAPRGVHDWAVANGVNWRTLLAPTHVVTGELADRKH